MSRTRIHYDVQGRLEYQYRFPSGQHMPCYRTGADRGFILQRRSHYKQNHWHDTLYFRAYIYQQVMSFEFLLSQI